MVFSRIRRTGVTAGCATCGSAELSPRAWGGPRLRRESRARLQTPPCCAASPPRAGESRAAPGKAPGWAELRIGGRWPHRPRPPPLSRRWEGGSGGGGGGRVVFSPFGVCPPPFGAQGGSLLPAAPPGRRRPGQGLLAVVLERFQVLPAPAAEKFRWPDTVLPEPLVFGGRGRRTRPLFRVPGALLAVCPWLMSRSLAKRRPQS